MLPVIARDVEPAIEAPLFITSLATKIEAVDCETLCETVYERFSREPELFALPVVEGVKPVGLVNRQGFLVRLADRFGRALFEQKPITKLMDPEPLVVVADEMTVEASSIRLLERFAFRLNIVMPRLVRGIHGSPDKPTAVRLSRIHTIRHGRGRAKARIRVTHDHPRFLLFFLGLEETKTRGCSPGACPWAGLPPVSRGEHDDKIVIESPF